MQAPPSTPPTKQRPSVPPPIVRPEHVVVQVAAGGGNPNTRQNLLGRLNLVAHPQDTGLAAMFAVIHM